MKVLDSHTKDAVLKTMAELIESASAEILAANALDMASFDREDLAMKDRLKVDQQKILDMMDSMVQLSREEDPIGIERYRFNHENGLEIVNRTAAFGTVLIIYESRPDVTVEAAGIAFKSGNRILLKGGKESKHSNKAIVKLWHKALEQHGLDTSWIVYLDLNRSDTQTFLKEESSSIDLIIPRGGEQLIRFVKSHAKCPVIVSGRGNNFAFVHPEVEQEKSLDILLNAKVAKISACNALDKILIDEALPNLKAYLTELIDALKSKAVEVKLDEALGALVSEADIAQEEEWYEEFLDYKILIGAAKDQQEAIDKINKYSGGHSATILTENQEAASHFMENVDSAAVYHNASTRFTDGFQFGLGGELAISTDKLHHRGPMGLGHLVTNKWYVYGKGQIR